MPIFKKKISEEELIAFLLTARQKIEEQVVDALKSDFQGEEKYLIYEARIFSLWVLTLALPTQNNQLRDNLHDSFCRSLNLQSQTKEIFYNDIDKRYEIYFDAFEKWQNKTHAVPLLGSAIIEIIVNQNTNFSFNKSLPMTDGDDDLKATVLFGELYKATLKSIGILKNKYRIPDLE